MNIAVPAQQTRQVLLRLLRAAGLVWRIAPGWTAMNVVLVVIQGMLPLAALYLMKRIIEAVTIGLKAANPAEAFHPVVIWIGLAAAVAVISALARSLSEYSAEEQSQRVTDAVADILHEKSIAVDLGYYEDPGYYDTLHRAQREAPYRPTRIVHGIIQVIQNILSLAGIFVLLVTFNWLVAVLLLAAALPGFFARLLHSRALFSFDTAQTETERKAWYYHDILTSTNYAKELRLLNFGSLFKNRYQDLRREIREGKLAISRRRLSWDLGAQVLVTLMMFGALAWLAYQTIMGQVTLGDLLVYYLGFQSGLGYAQSTLRALAGLYEDNLFLSNFFRFLDMHPKVTAPPDPVSVPQPMPQEIVFRGVDFAYSNRIEEAVRNIDLTIRPGEVIALVGESGSGKSTLIKLLSRLYDPTNGSVEVGGVDLRDLDPVEWRKEISVVLQDFAHYPLTVWENIWLGDVTVEPEHERVVATAQRSGADAVIRRLPNQYDSMLGYWFKNGQEVSGGEWQKIALARAFWRESKLLILDEPTSSLDPLAEEELFRNLRQILDGRSAILISHRFSTVQMADRIYVMERGRITEGGTHTELLALGGQYAQLYLAQARYYRNKGL